MNRFVRWTSEHLASDQAAERKELSALLLATIDDAFFLEAIGRRDLADMAIASAAKQAGLTCHERLGFDTNTPVAVFRELLNVKSMDQRVCSRRPSFLADITRATPPSTYEESIVRWSSLSAPMAQICGCDFRRVWVSSQ